jgi:hypothetical protein
MPKVVGYQLEKIVFVPGPTAHCRMSFIIAIGLVNNAQSMRFGVTFTCRADILDDTNSEPTFGPYTNSAVPNGMNGFFNSLGTSSAEIIHPSGREIILVRPQLKGRTQHAQHLIALVFPKTSPRDISDEGMIRGNVIGRHQRTNDQARRGLRLRLIGGGVSFRQRVPVLCR